MSNGLVRLLAAVAMLLALASALILLTSRAAREGRMTHCRNNLRHIGHLAHAQFAANYESLPDLGGRAFWQSVREFKYYDPRNRKWIAPPMNPFCCPVRTGAPLTFEGFDPARLAAHCADPGTIDFRGPAGFPEAPSKMILGADRAGNHPGGGGHVLIADLSILKTSEAVSVDTEWSRDGTTRD